jgi:hypothetical protein
MSFQSLFDATWFVFLEDEAKVLVTQSVELVERERRMRSQFHDYSFVVFPMAKAYESFLKKFLYTIGLIDRGQYEHRQFRIGRSLNPDIPKRFRDHEWVYGNLSAACSDELSRNLWDAWLTCRNHLFHYFPEEKSNITLDQAEKLLHQMDDVMSGAFLCVKRRV